MESFYRQEEGGTKKRMDLGGTEVKIVKLGWDYTIERVDYFPR